jgi:hypothetical protein
VCQLLDGFGYGGQRALSLRAEIATSQHDVSFQKGVAHRVHHSAGLARDKGGGGLPDCLTVHMTKRILTALTAISFLLLVFASPHAAQEGRRLGDRTQIGTRQTDARLILTTEDAEALRSDLVTGYSDLDALLRMYGDYPALKASFAMIGYEDVLRDLGNERDRIKSLSAEDIMRQSRSLPDGRTIRRLATVLEKAMTEGRFITALEKANRAMLSSNGSASLQAIAELKGLHGKDLVASPSFIKPGCNYDTPNDYASASDLGITNSIIIAESTVIDSLPDSFSVAGFSAPNVARIALVIARGVTEEILNGLEISNGNGMYCEQLRLFIEDKMKDNEGYIVIMAVPYSDGGYLDYVKDSVNAIVSKASSKGYPLNCAQARLSEANNYFGSGQWLQAYKKYQAAYQNIGASSCVQ